MKISYPAKISKEGDGFIVEIIGLENCVTGGDTREETLFNGAEALSGVLEVMLEEGDDIPLPAEKGGNCHIEPAADVQVALLTYFSLKLNESSLAELARQLGTSWARAQRLTKPGGNPTLKKLEQVAASFGKKLIISFE